MRISGRKYVITGAGRGLGAALAIVMADHGANPVLLARNGEALANTAATVRSRTGQVVATLICDLADAGNCQAIGLELAQKHPDIDGLVHNGAMWLPGALGATRDEDIQSCILSASVGPLVLTRRLLPTLRARPDADIYTVVSTSGLRSFPLLGTSVAFRAAKAAQDGFVQGLADELKQTSIRVSAIYPGDFDDISPLEPAWTETRRPDDPLTNREVVDAIIFALNFPANAVVSALVIEQSGTDVSGSNGPSD